MGDEGQGKRGDSYFRGSPFYEDLRSADIYAALRSGTDIAFLGGMINYILENNKYFKDYVDGLHQRLLHRGDKFSFNDGLFSGYDAATESTTSRRGP